MTRDKHDFIPIKLSDKCPKMIFNNSNRIMPSEFTVKKNYERACKLELCHTGRDHICTA